MYHPAGLSKGERVEATNIAQVQKFLTRYLGGDVEADLQAHPEVAVAPPPMGARVAPAHRQAAGSGVTHASPAKRSQVRSGGSSKKRRSSYTQAAELMRIGAPVGVPEPEANPAPVPPQGYCAWHELRGLTEDGRITKAYYLQGTGAGALTERLVVVGIEGERKDKHYHYSLVDDLGGLLPDLGTVNNGRLVKEYLDYILSWKPGPDMAILPPCEVDGIFPSNEPKPRRRDRVPGPQEMSSLGQALEGTRNRAKPKFYDPSKQTGRNVARCTISGMRDGAHAGGAGGGGVRFAVPAPRARAAPQKDRNLVTCLAQLPAPIQSWASPDPAASGFSEQEVETLKGYISVLTAVINEDDNVDPSLLGGVKVVHPSQVKAILRGLLDRRGTPPLALLEQSGIARPVAALRTHPSKDIADLAEALARRWAEAVEEVASAIMQEPSKLTAGHCFAPRNVQAAAASAFGSAA